MEAQLAHNLMRLIAEQDSTLHRSAVHTYLALLDKGTALSETLRMVGWGGVRGGHTCTCCSWWAGRERGGGTRVPAVHGGLGGSEGGAHVYLLRMVGWGGCTFIPAAVDKD